MRMALRITLSRSCLRYWMRGISLRLNTVEKSNAPREFSMFGVQIAASLDVTIPPFIKADHIAFQLVVSFYGAPIPVAVEKTMVTVREIAASSLLFNTTRPVFRFFCVLVVPRL